jgi:predicted ester cyclase
MSVEDNKALVHRYYEDAPSHPDACDEIFAPHFQFHTIQHAAHPDADSSPQSEKATYEWLKAVWGDWRMTIDEMIAEGDRVMVRWTFHGTQRGEYMGLPPTHRPATYSGINIFRIDGGKIAEVWDIYDRLWLWQQLGAIPETEAFIAQARAALSPQSPADEARR